MKYKNFFLFLNKSNKPQTQNRSSDSSQSAFHGYNMNELTLTLHSLTNQKKPEFFWRTEMFANFVYKNPEKYHFISC